jgi:methionyl-tRNA formyltransferase
MSRYIIAASRGAPLSVFSRRRHSLPGTWVAVGGREDLSLEMLRAFAPRYIFFPHWSWKVPKDILDAFECVCFHMTDVPYGRGGTPLQNLIGRGHRSTQLSALRMTEELDAGPVYAKRALSLDGTADEIYRHAYEISHDIMAWMVAHEPVAVVQSGEITTFERHKPGQSVLPIAGSIESLYDHIRMLDADGYPKAYVTHGDWKLELTQARTDGDALEARVRLTMHQTSLGTTLKKAMPGSGS